MAALFAGAVGGVVDEVFFGHLWRGVAIGAGISASTMVLRIFLTSTKS